jgi:hypothetical protein
VHALCTADQHVVFDYALANAHQNPFGFVGDCLKG